MNYIKNIAVNFIWICSGVAWLFCQNNESQYWQITLWLATVAFVVVAVKCSNIQVNIKKIDKKINFLAFGSSIGSILFVISERQANVYLACFSGWFLFHVLVHFYSYLAEVLEGVIGELAKYEKIIVIGTTVAYLLFLLFAFIKSDAFYMGPHGGDIIYTSDSRMLVEKNAYMSLYHAENDIRQPLFAVMSTPFMGICYALSQFFSFIPNATAVFIGIGQMLMVIFTNVLLLRIMNLKGMGRIIFFLYSSLLYPSILFSIMMEQYVVAYFWLILTVYSIVNGKEKTDIALIGASGSLLTSSALVLLMEKWNKEQWKQNALHILQVAGKGVFALLLFGRGDIFFSLWDKLSDLCKFTGESVRIQDKILQYVAFVKACFIPPVAGENWALFGRASWQQKPVVTLSVIGIILIIAVGVGFYSKNRDTLRRIALFWVAFSVLILCILGWGTAENGLVLYTLYFGWAFWILVYDCVERLIRAFSEKGRIVVWTVILLLLVLANGKGILELLIFARTNFPA